MNKVNNILKMISQMDANANEIKLAQHEVHLAIMDELLNSTEKSRKLILAYGENSKKLKNAQRIIFNEGELSVELLQKYVVSINELKKLMTKAEGLYKELGIRIPDSDKAYFNAYNLYENFTPNNAEYYINHLKEVLSQKEFIS